MTATGYTSNGVFEEEAYELLSDLENSLLQTEETPDDPETIARIFRALHTIKGSAAMFGFDNISTFLHKVESVFDLVRNGHLGVSKRLIDLTLSAGDEVKRMLEAKPGSGQDRSRADNIAASFEIFLHADESKGEGWSKPLPPARDNRPDSAASTYRVRFSPRANVFTNGTNLVPLLAELADLGDASVIARIEGIPSLEEIEPEACYISWDIILTTASDTNQIRDVFIFVEDSAEIAIEAVDGECFQDEGPDYKRLGEILVEKGDVAADKLNQVLDARKPIGAMLVEAGETSLEGVESALVEQQRVREIRGNRASSEAGASIRVASDKLDGLVNLVGELVTVEARLSRFAGKSKDLELVAIAEEVERLTRDLRDSAMSMRMLPIGTTFGRFKRLVRDLSGELGKEVELVTSGASTELDKTVIERLNDPLVHLIRNSIDHGIEPPEIRIAAGKPRVGTVHLSAKHSGAQVVIEIEDDGAGLNRERIREKAMAKGLVSSTAQLSDREIFNLIFMAGFSTAEQVTSVSGRGVGMDVVKTSLEALRGSAEVESAAGMGTKIRLKLPLTLAIIEGLLVGVGDGFFVLPVSYIEECVEVKGNEDGYGEQGNRLLNIRDKLVPCISLRNLYETGGKGSAVEQAVIVNMGSQQVGLVVDNVVGEMQAVMKNLGSVYRKTEGISGATILGDGQIALIVDVPQLVEGVERRERRQVGGCQAS
ncbi:MAG TPA: chemotaxis protein CheA [Deltaproteobacteria bacterium]|nr:chemotaxis protein CheA [Deltaproteobacteria bacterium]